MKPQNRYIKGTAAQVIDRDDTLLRRVQAVGNRGGSYGVLCLGGAIGRFVGPGQVQGATASGTISLTLDLTQLPTANGLVGAGAGETWNFQAWYRDVSGGVVGSNFTDGVSVVFD